MARRAASAYAQFMTRLFKLRLRPGRSLHSYGGSPNIHHGPGEEVTVPEDIAASMLRNKAAEVIEIVDEPADAPKRLSDQT